MKGLATNRDALLLNEAMSLETRFVLGHPRQIVIRLEPLNLVVKSRLETGVAMKNA